MGESKKPSEKALLDELKQARQRIVELEKAAHYMGTRATELAGEKIALTEKVAGLERENAELRKHNAELRKQNAVLQNDLDDWAGVPDVK